MVYEFKIRLSSKDGEKSRFVYFIVMDLPGKENIKNTYVNNDMDNNKAKDFGISINDTYYTKYKDSIKAAIFLNPMFITIFPDIAKNFIEWFNESHYKKELPADNYFIQRYYTDTTYSLLSFLTQLEDKGSVQYKLITSMYPENSRTDTKIQNFWYSIIASEIFKYILTTNKINILIEYYNTKLLKSNEEFNSKNYGALPFEAIYINENILGLINILGKKLNKEYSKPDNIMEKYFIKNAHLSFSEKVPNELGFRDKISNDETITQFYFIRNLLRGDLINKTNSTNTTLFNNDTPDVNILNTLENYTNISFNGKTIQQWIEDPYNYNKSFIENESKSPIETFLNSYFKTISDRSMLNIPANKTQIIDNIYLFYVVSNDDPKKCANQIKLISDSKEFINIINSWVPDSSQKTVQPSLKKPKPYPPTSPPIFPPPSPPIFPPP